MSSTIDYVYNTQVPSSLVLAKHGFPSNAKRIPTPTKTERNVDIAIYTEGFRDFSKGISGDFVVLDYYLETNGCLISMEKGVGSEYFRRKASLLGVDLKASKSNSKPIIPKKLPPKVPEIVQAKKQSTSDISKSFVPLFKYMYKKDRSLVFEHLMKRGMTKEEVLRSPFTVSPKEEDINNILNIVNNYGTNTEGLPGFYEGPGGAFTLKISGNPNQTNLMIPIFNTKKELVSFHFRGLGVKSPYWSLSSNGEKKGCSPGTPTGLWGKFNSDTILITEGALKGYLAHIWTGMTVMYVLGVGSQTMLDEALQDAYKAGVRHATLAFDMDYDSKEQVQEAVDKVKLKVRNAGMSFNTLKWDSKYNGIDDYLLYAKQNNIIDKVVNYIYQCAEKRKR